MGLLGHSPATIVVVDEQPETAEFISRVMHDAGQSISVLWANSALRLQKSIKSQSPHVVIAQTDLKWLPIGKICELCDGLNAVVLALGEESNSQLELKAISHGAFAYINNEQQALMVLQIDRALQQAALLSEHQQQQQQLDDLNARSAALLDTANEPITYTSEGVITGANKAFAKLAGVTDEKALIGRLISDFIAPKSLYKFSHALRTLIRGEQNHLNLEETDFITAGYRQATAKLLMQNLMIDGEHSTQLLLRNINIHSDNETTEAAEYLAAESSNHQVVEANYAAPPLVDKPAKLAELTVVPPLVANNQYRFELKPLLDEQKLESKLSQINASSDTQQSNDADDSANDDLITQSLNGVLTSDEAELCAQPLVSLHAGRSMVIARIRANDRLMPISQILTEPWDPTTSRWLFTQLEGLAKQSKLVLGPVSKDTISAASIESLQGLKLKDNLVLGIAEQTLSQDYHGSSQFLLQCQKLKIGIALWMDSTPKVLADLLSDLPDSIRSGINTLVLSEQTAPQLDKQNLDKQIVDKDWAELLGRCEQFNIQTIAPVPSDKQALQTWWQLGADWCLTPETNASALPSYIEPTGTLPH